MLEGLVRVVMKAATRDNFSTDAMFLKLTEEVGELAEATNHAQGRLPHKQMKEPQIGEVADVIICAIAVLVKTRGLNIIDSFYDLDKELTEQIIKKLRKWEGIIDDRETAEFDAAKKEGVFMRSGDFWIPMCRKFDKLEELEHWAKVKFEKQEYTDSDSYWHESIEFDIDGKRYYAVACYEAAGPMYDFKFGTYDEVNGKTDATITVGTKPPLGIYVDKRYFVDQFGKELRVK